MHGSVALGFQELLVGKLHFKNYYTLATEIHVTSNGDPPSPEVWESFLASLSYSLQTKQGKE